MRNSRRTCWALVPEGGSLRVSEVSFVVSSHYKRHAVQPGLDGGTGGSKQFNTNESRPNRMKVAALPFSKLDSTCNSLRRVAVSSETVTVAGQIKERG